MMKDGVIKFAVTKKDEKPLSPFEIAEIEKWRKIVHQEGLIGHDYIHKVGYGNISKRESFPHLHQTTKPQFIISGSQTGHQKHLSEYYYVRVLDYDVEKFTVLTSGSHKASSESLTHASFYEANINIRAIIHAHHNQLWSKLIKMGHPSTPLEIEYGTYELAAAVHKLVKDKNEGILVTIGHEGGIFAYGDSLERATHLLLSLQEQYC